MKRIITTLALAATMVLATASVALAGGPRCQDQVLPGSVATGWENHATHIIEQYILGGGFDALDGNPSDEMKGGQVESSIVVANAGTAGRGHLAGGVPPGASFCDSPANN